MKGVNGVRVDYVTICFASLLKRAGLIRTGVGFYALRHTFYTIASQTTGTQAVSRIVGHKLGGMADTYCQQVDDVRLRRASNFVRQQVLGIAAAKTGIVAVSEL